MRRPVIAGNWKMFKLLSEAVDTALALKPLVANASHCEIVIAPVFTALKTVADRLEGSNIRVAAQNCAAESKHGAHTGEVAADMIKDVGCSHVIIGHSERRQFYGDTDAVVAAKTVAALAGGLTPIACVGETLAERDAGATMAVVSRQLEAVLGAVGENAVKIVVAYEPVWAIGTGRTASPEEAQAVHARVRARLEQSGAGDVAVLYGGSVKPDNAKALFAMADIDGGLIGGASLKAAEFLAIAGA